MGVQCRVCRRPFRFCTGSNPPLADGQLRVGRFPGPWGTFRQTVESIFRGPGVMSDLCSSASLVASVGVGLHKFVPGFCRILFLAPWARLTGTTVRRPGVWRQPIQPRPRVTGGAPGSRWTHAALTDADRPRCRTPSVVLGIPSAGPCVQAGDCPIHWERNKITSIVGRRKKA